MSPYGILGKEKRLLEYRYFKNELNDLHFAADNVLYFSDKELMKWDINHNRPEKVVLRPQGKKTPTIIRQNIKFTIGHHGRMMAIADGKKLIIKNLIENIEETIETENRVERVVSSFHSEEFAYHESNGDIYFESFIEAQFHNLSYEPFGLVENESPISNLHIIPSEQILITGFAVDTGQHIIWNDSGYIEQEYEYTVNQGQNIQIIRSISDENNELLHFVAKKKTSLNLSDLQLTNYTTPQQILKIAASNKVGTGYLYHHITKLDLSHNHLSEITLEDNVLSNITELNLDTNQISKLDARKLPNTITELNLNNNQLTEIDFTIRNLSDLKIFHLENNQISRISEGIAELRALEEIKLAGNQFMEIPSSLKFLKGLKELDLSRNQIEEINLELLKEFSQDLVLNLEGNRIEGLSEELYYTEIKNIIKSLNTLQNIEQNTTILILTPIQVEFDAICNFFKERKLLTDDSNGITYTLVTFKGRHKLYQIAIKKTGSRNENIALATERAVQFFKPAVAILLGIAGGIKDVQLGDIVIGTKAYGYEAGKITANGYVGRPNVVNSSHSLIELADMVSQNQSWQRWLDQPNPDIKVLLGAIASGNKVITNTKHEVYLRLKQFFNDTLAIEMEAIGFSKVFLAHPYILFINIRSISDMLDNISLADAEGYQERAATHAAAFTMEFIYQSNFSQELDKMIASLSQMIFPFIQRDAFKLIGRDFGNVMDRTVENTWNKIKGLFIEELDDIVAEPNNETNIIEVKIAIKRKIRKQLEKNGSFKEGLEELFNQNKTSEREYDNITSNIEISRDNFV